MGIYKRGRLVRTYTLGCSPPTGTHPDPVEACAALRSYVKLYPHITPETGNGPSQLAPLLVKGRLDGKPIPQIHFGRPLRLYYRLANYWMIAFGYPGLCHQGPVVKRLVTRHGLKCSLLDPG